MHCVELVERLHAPLRRPVNGPKRSAVRSNGKAAPEKQARQMGEGDRAGYGLRVTVGRLPGIEDMRQRMDKRVHGVSDSTPTS